MKKIYLVILTMMPQLAFPTVVAYHTATNELVAIGNITPSQFRGFGDIDVADIPDSRIAKPPAGSTTYGLSLLVFNPGSQSVDLKSQVLQDGVRNQSALQQDVLQIIQLRAYLVAGTQLGNAVSSQVLKDQIAIATNTIQAQIDAVVAKH